MYILIILLLSTGEEVNHEKWFKTEALCEQRWAVVNRSLSRDTYKHACFFDARQTPKEPDLPQDQS